MSQLFQLFFIIAIIKKIFFNYSIIAMQNGDLGWNSLQKSGALRFLEASPPQSAFGEIRVAGFATGRAAREASFRSGSLWVCASTHRWLPALARNNLSNCNKYLFEHVHTWVTPRYRTILGFTGSWMVYYLLSFRRSPPLLEAWNGEHKKLLVTKLLLSNKLLSKSYITSTARRI